MSRRTRHRPRNTGGGQLRGLGGPHQPADKAEPGAGQPSIVAGGTDTGPGRALGLDTRDIPGGKPHLVNPESPGTRPAPKDPRPLFEGMNAHGVVDPSGELGYTDPPADVKPGPKSGTPEPAHYDEAVPVYQVEGPGHQRRIRSGSTVGPFTIPNGDVAPRKVCDRDPDRVTLLICNENATNGNLLRAGSRADCDQSAGFGLPGNRTVTEIKGWQDELYVWNTAAAAITWSAILITEIPLTVGPE